uniref:FAD dependent oxidoreductase n=1 Tax=Loa loa TaxID=7209 RepID=A0A1I7VMR1_LOALO
MADVIVGGDGNDMHIIWRNMAFCVGQSGVTSVSAGLVTPPLHWQDLAKQYMAKHSLDLYADSWQFSLNDVALDPIGLCQALRKRDRNHGVQIFEQCFVEEVVVDKEQKVVGVIQIKDNLKLNAMLMPLGLGTEYGELVCSAESYTANKYRVIGETAQIQGYYVATGFSGQGLAFAGGARNLVAGLVCGETLAVDIARLEVTPLTDLHTHPQYLIERIPEVAGSTKCL